MHESESVVAQSCLTLRNPTDCSLPGSSVRGIFQARVLEWVAIEWLIPVNKERSRNEVNTSGRKKIAIPADLVLKKK